VLALVAPVAVVAALLWATTAVSTVVTGHRWPSIGAGDMLAGARGVLETPGDPSRGFVRYHSAQTVAGPVAWWAVFVVLVALTAGIAW